MMARGNRRESISRDDRNRLARLDSFWPDHHNEKQVKDRLYDALRIEQSRITVLGDRS